MIQKEFAEKVASIVKKDDNIIGLAVGGSWISDELDEYSDLDLLLITSEKIGGDKKKMMTYARRFGDLVSGFTGEHVSEPRLLICLYDNPLLHVDIKFITLPEMAQRVEDPVILFERDGLVSTAIKKSKAVWPETDLQWIEDRFWTWVHYLATKLARGEYFECLDGLGFLRAVVLTPLLQLKSKTRARGMRKVETKLTAADLENLKITVAAYDSASIIKALDNSIGIYRTLRKKLFPESIELQAVAEKLSMDYYKKIKQKAAGS